MEIEERKKQDLDLLKLFENLLSQARRTWVLGLLLILLFGGCMAQGGADQSAQNDH